MHGRLNRGLGRRLNRRLALCALGLAAAVAAAAFALRLLLIEPPAFAWACQIAEPPGWCPLRAGAILALRAGLLGVAALAIGLVALFRRHSGAALAAIGLGAAGLVLYAPEPASAGVLLGALALTGAASRLHSNHSSSHTDADSSSTTPPQPHA